MRLGWVGCAWLCVLGSLSCGSEEPAQPPDPGAVHVTHLGPRLACDFDDEKPEQRIIAEWRFDDPAIWDDADAVGAARIDPELGLVIQPESGAPVAAVDLAVDVDADSINAALLRSKALQAEGGGSGALYWRGPGEQFDDARSLRFDIPATHATRFRLQALELGSHPLWKGPIEAIRIVPRIDPVPVVVSNLLLCQANLAVSAALRNRSRSLPTVDGQVRDSVYAKIPSSQECRVKLNGEARIRTSVALLGKALPKNETIRFSVHARGGDGREELLAEKVVGGTEIDQWIPFEIDSAEHREERDLVFRVEKVGGGEETRVIALWGAPVLLERKSGGGGGNLPNILLVSLDTLRPDHLGLYGYDRPTSPHLDRLAADSFVFDRAYCQAPGTLASHSSLFTSRYAGADGGFGYKGLTEDDETLAQRLRSAGYYTAAFTDGGYMGAIFGLGIGFDLYDDRAGGIEAVFSRASEFFDWAGEMPFFAVVHTYDVHTPYAPPASYRELLTDDWERLPDAITSQDLDARVDAGTADASFWQEVTDLYDAGIRHTDDRLRELLDHLEVSGLAEDTIVVVLSDHGEELGERGGSEHGDTLFEEQIRVPWILHVPASWRARLGLEEPKRLGEIAELVDVGPTLLNLVRAELPQSVDGESLLPLLQSRRLETSTAIAGFVPGTHDGFAVVSERWKLMTFQGNRAATKLRVVLEDGRYLFDLPSDPGEQENLFEEDHAAARALRAHLASERERWGRGGGATSAPTLDTKTEQELRRLGYIKGK